MAGFNTLPQPQDNQLPPVDPARQQLTQNLAPQPGVETAPPETPPPPPSAQPNPIKNLLKNFFYYGGQAALKHVGLPTDEELKQKQFQQNVQLRQTESLEGLRSSMEQANQLVPIQLPTGETVQLPAKSAGTVLAAQQRSQTQQAIAALNQKFKALGLGYQINPDTQAVELIARENLSPLQQSQVTKNEQPKTPTEIALQSRADQG